MIDLAIRRPVATAAIYVALFALGVTSFRLIPVEDLPEVEFPRLTVAATWNGASPEALEAFVTAPLETVIQQVGGVEKVISESSADPRGTGSSARIDIDFERDTRMEFARLELSERINSIRDELPEGVMPSLSEYVPQEFAEEEEQLLSFSLTGPYTFARLGEIAEEEIEPFVRGLPGVSAVEVYGAERREIAVELDRGRLEALGLRPEEVSARIAELSEPKAPGSVELDGRQFAIAVRTRALEVSDIADMIVLTRPDGAVRVGDLGQVRDQTEDPRMLWRIDSRPTISISVYRQSGTNVIQVADDVKAAMTDLASTLPAGVGLELRSDQSENIREQLTELRLRAIAAAIVIFIVLTIFLRSLGAVLVVFATIGFSILTAVNFLYIGGFSLNLLTLWGLAWGFGLVVDNGIVVLENVERHRRAGAGPSDAARRGARQVVLPVLAATMTTAIVLVPFLFLQGELRVYYLPLSFAVGFSIIASLFVAFTFVPALASRVARMRDSAGAVVDPALTTGEAASAPTRRSEPLYITGYRSLLGFALRHPVLIAVVCLGSLAGSWYLFDEHVNTGRYWSGFGGGGSGITITISFPRGAGLERADELTRSFEAKLATIDEVERFEAQVRPNYAYMRAEFPEEIEHTSIPVAIKDQMVAYSYGFSGVDVFVRGYGPSFYGGGSSPPNYSLQVLGYNYLTVQEIAEEIASRLTRFSRIRDVDPNANSGYYRRDKEFEYYVEPDREALAAYNLPVSQLLDYVSRNIEGRPSGSRIRVGGEEVQYAVKVDGYREFDFYDLSDLRVPISSREELRLANVAEVGRRQVLASIRREDQQYERTVAWEFRGPVKLGDVVRDAVVDAMELPPGYRIEKSRFGGWTTEETTQMWVVLAFSILLIYMVTAGLFESLAAPFVVLFSLPFALIGVFLIFFYTDATFTRTAFIGTIMMGGIVVNNAILVVYHIGELRKRMPTGAAIVQGTLERVRPILMTTLTTVFGLLPLVLFASSQDENIWNALALATIGGLISSTLFVLVAIPVAYRYIVARRV
ncbi:efflux RND transporter permease subunit [Candidatus Palauibacter sp.]|uniref:efflux RND transporter permease subunit n=1 Tax=Candidatus Palauibacter sp. TaxID=3101350 RepID=UPI003B51A78C